MAEKTIAGVTVNLTEDGYLTDPSQWTREIAAEMAREYDIELTDQHFAVIDYIREKYHSGEALTIRAVGKSGIVDIEGLYTLFPKGPLKLASKFAGIPKPTSCV
jgi:tRNA 2-thiouridine synthesizing protein E